MIAWVLFTSGGLICALNAYLSWVRYPLHRARGRSAASFRWASGVPLVGSALVLGAWAVTLRSLESAWINATAVALLLADSGGPLWFAIQVVRERIRGRDSAK